MGNSLCPEVSRCASVRGTESYEREPAAAGSSGLWLYCPDLPAIGHSDGAIATKSIQILYGKTSQKINR